MLSPLLENICADISRSLGRSFVNQGQVLVGGGCISRTFRLSNDEESFFVKVGEASVEAMFRAEILGLETLRASGELVLPKVICCGHVDDHAFLVLSWEELGGPANYAALGNALARLHRKLQGHAFGFDEDNFIGATPQKNTWGESWQSFFFDQRLAFQIELAQAKGGRFPLFSKLYDKGRCLLSDHSVVPSAVHGDLWSGNVSFLSNGTPIIYDVATYFGDREVDLAMSQLFGGFPPAFYQAYEAVWPLAHGFQTRFELYNLYHILNHFNLFGVHYEAQANNMISNLVSSL